MSRTKSNGRPKTDDNPTVVSYLVVLEQARKFATRKAQRIVDKEIKPGVADLWEQREKNSDALGELALALDPESW